MVWLSAHAWRRRSAASATGIFLPRPALFWKTRNAAVVASRPKNKERLMVIYLSTALGWRSETSLCKFKSTTNWYSVLEPVAELKGCTGRAGAVSRNGHSCGRLHSASERNENLNGDPSITDFNLESMTASWETCLCPQAMLEWRRRSGAGRRPRRLPRQSWWAGRRCERRRGG